MTRASVYSSVMWAAAICAAVVLAPLPVAVRAEEPATQPTTRPSDQANMRKWLADLASPDASVRDAARARMMTLSRDDLPALQDLVRRSMPLAPSQAIALRQIVEEVYLADEPYEAAKNQGFLGILMDQGGTIMRDFDHGDQSHVEPGVIVAERIPGFCASRTLLDGDVILGTTNPRMIFTDSASLQHAVQAMNPGETMHLEVLRNGRIVDVPLVLDPKPLDATPATISSFKLQRAAKFRDYWQSTFGPLLKEDVG